MSSDELRAGFSRLAERVVPMEDPHGRLMVRRRKRFRHRFASLATVAAAVLAGGLAAPAALFNTASGPNGDGSSIEVDRAVPPVASEYLTRLVKAPVRGNLSGETAMVEDARVLFTSEKGVMPYAAMEATEANLVFLNRTDGMLQLVVIYVDQRGQTFALTRGSTKEGASVKDLASDNPAQYPVSSPFLVAPVYDEDTGTSSVVGLSPPGCAVESSAEAELRSDGTWNRTYRPEPTGDYVIRSARPVNELWRVRCDGQVREVRPADDMIDSVGVDENATIMYERVVKFGGNRAGNGIVLWQGEVPGYKTSVTLVASQSLPGPALLAVGPFMKSWLATEPTTKDSWSDPGEISMVSLGVAGSGLTAVRLPHSWGGHPMLTDRVLVHTKSNSVRVEAVDGGRNLVASASLDKDRIAVLTFGPGVAQEIRAVGPTGVAQATMRFAEPVKGARVLGDQLFRAW